MSNNILTQNWSPVDLVLSRLGLNNVKKVSGGYMARCPVHDDKNPSLSITEGDDGRVLLKCFAGCSTEEIVKALGLTMSDLFPPSSKPQKKKADVLPTYFYTDEKGKIIFGIVRTPQKQFMAVHLDGDGWAYGMGGANPTIYNLPKVVDAVNKGELVFVVEGEKDADNLTMLGFVATTNPFGAGKWHDEYSNYLKNADVVIIPDNDEVGRRHAEQVARSLVGKAKRIRLLELPNLPPKGDVSDWLAAGGTKEALLKLAEQAPLYEPKDGPGQEDAGAVVELPPPTKDLGHALILAELWRDRYRWAEHRKSWMRWTGKRWEPITDNQISAEASADLRAEYARRLATARSNDEIKRLTDAVLETCIFSKINGALNFLKGMVGFHTNPEEWDADLWALNCNNGIIDLRTGQLKPHTPAELCTKLAPVDYDPNAKSEKWEAHLKRFLPNPNIRRQVQRDLGLSLTGANLDEILPIWYGTGSNGKSTTAKVILAVLGDYAEMAPKDLLILQKHEGHPTEIANLAGKRCVFASEIEQGARLNEAKVKLLTGGDKIKARFLYCDFFEFDQTWTITLFCNHKPIITGTDYAIWRRVRLVPWTEKISDAEKKPQDEIIRELLAEGPAILKWLLDGLADWQHDHHWMADEVKAATEEYRQEQDRLAGFFADCCEFGPHWSVAVADLYNAYVEWCEREGEEPLKKRSFGERLRDRGITQKKQTGGARFWLGIRLIKNSGVEWQTFRKFPMRNDIKKVTETTPLNATNFYEHEQSPKNNIVINATTSDPESWPICQGCNRKVPEINETGLCDDCVACAGGD